MGTGQFGYFMSITGGRKHLILRNLMLPLTFFKPFSGSKTAMGKDQEKKKKKKTHFPETAAANNY